MNIKKKTVLIIEYSDLPNDIMEIVSEWPYFSKDILLEMISEFTVQDIRLDKDILKTWWKADKKEHGYKGTFLKFIEDNNYKFEKWLLDQNLDLTGIDEILIDTSW